MEIQTASIPKTQVLKSDEKILVVNRNKILDDENLFSGFLPITNFDKYLKIIETQKEFIWRSKAETDNTYKQIIPYLIFSFQGKLFLMQRKSTASEERLKNKYSLGIGGHIREEDMQQNNIFNWAKREFIEEVNYQGNLTIKPMGLVNDESNDVGKVHLGFIFLLIGDSSNISVKSELKQGTLTTLQECENLYSSMETWSQLSLSYLKTIKL